jgi:SAM-dependent methyltransferase
MTAYDRLAIWYDPMYRAMGIREFSYDSDLARALIGFASSIGAVDVLDCACGTGNPIIGLKHLEPQLRVWGTDANRRMLGECVLNALKTGVAVQPLDADGDHSAIHLGLATWEQLPEVFSRRFDLVMCRGQTIYHLVERSAIVEAIRHMAALLRPGGSVLLDVLRWSPDLHGEEGRDHVKFRGWLPPDDHANPLGCRVIFVDSLSYREDPRAVRGVIQTKSLMVLGDFPEGARVIEELAVDGAPFTAEDLGEMAGEAGLTEISQLDIQGPRYAVVVGRRKG